MPSHKEAERHPISLRNRLLELAADYHHLKAEHQRQSPESSARRHIEHKMEELRERFERLLERWVDEASLREAWRRHAYHGDPAPEQPAPSYPLLFKGKTVDGAIVELRRDHDGRIEIRMNGKKLRHEDDLPPIERTSPHARYSIYEFSLEEIFDASPEALAAMQEHVRDPSGEPPWSFAPELFEDGLIDLDFCLTPRGKRALAALAASA